MSLPLTVRVWLADLESPVIGFDASQVYIPLSLCSRFGNIKHEFVWPSRAVPLNFHTNVGGGTEA